MKKHQFISIFSMGFILLVLTAIGTSGQNNSDDQISLFKLALKTVDTNVEVKTAGTVDVYEVWMGQGHVYSLTAGAKKYNCENPFGGDNIEMTLFFPEIRKFIKIDKQQGLRPVYLNFISDVDGPVYVAVNLDTPRCQGYTLQLTTTDPSIFRLPDSRRISRGELNNIRSSFAEMPPPVPSEILVKIFDLYKNGNNEYENWRKDLERDAPKFKMMMTGPFHHYWEWQLNGLASLDLVRNSTEAFYDYFSAGDFLLNSNEQGKTRMEEIKGDADESFSQAGRVAEKSGTVYFELVELPNTFELYRQSLEAWTDPNKAEMKKEYLTMLDSLQADYDRSFPAAFAELDASIRKDKFKIIAVLLQKEYSAIGTCGVECWWGEIDIVLRPLINEKLEPLYQRMQTGLNQIKLNGTGNGVQWKCNFRPALSSRDNSSPFCYTANPRIQ